MELGAGASRDSALDSGTPQQSSLDPDLPWCLFSCVVLNIYLFLVALGLSCGKRT